MNRSIEPLLALARAIDPARAAAQQERFSTALRGSALGLGVALCTAYPAWAPLLEARPDDLASALELEAGPRRADYARFRQRMRQEPDPERLRSELRRKAQAERLRIALRELLPTALGGADLEVTARELSDLADMTIEVALAEACRNVFAQHGQPRRPDGAPSRLVVLGLGKLGGRELNAGSDVDLVCFYDTDEAVALSPGGGQLSAHEVWSRVVRRMTANLEDATDDGMVWRVDLRLRPEGSSGPLVNSLAAAERYYESFGRLWERAALLRARRVAGDAELAVELAAMLQPFVWTRRVDPSIAAALHELGERARVELCAEPERDLKLGTGGIREAELFVQALQLIWGGRDPRLRSASTMVAAARLRTAGLLTEREADQVTSAYLGLRRCEHAVQWSTGLQTHLLPTDPSELERLARSQGFASAEALSKALSEARQAVRRLFSSLLPRGGPAVSRWAGAVTALEAHDRVAFARALERAEMRAVSSADLGMLARHLFELGRQPSTPLGAQGREQHRPLLEATLDAVADAADPEQAAAFLRGFFGRTRHPGITTRLMADDPRAIRRLVAVLGASGFVGQAVVTRPELGDLVLFARERVGPTQARAEVLEAMGEPTDESQEPLEQQVGLLRRAKQRITTEVALADLAGEIDTAQTTTTLSALAEASLEAATRLALDAGADDELQGMSVLGMGKLGGGELGYGSDLDVIFLFDPARAPDDPTAHFSRCARRVIQLISMPHSEGPGYQLDARLRPSGSQGLLVVSLDGFARYHRVHLGDRADGVAATEAPAPGSQSANWERLALLKARFVAGDRRLGLAAEDIAHRAAYGWRGDVGELARDLHRLRQRMEAELARERPGRHDIKFGRGGLLDVELCVELLQMHYGSDERVHTTNTALAIEALGEVGALAPPELDWLRDGYRFLRRLEQRIRIVHGDSAHLIEQDAAGLEPLARRMGFRDGPAARSAATLLDAYGQVADRVRRCYQAIVVAAAEQAG